MGSLYLYLQLRLICCSTAVFPCNSAQRVETHHCLSVKRQGRRHAVEQRSRFCSEDSTAPAPLQNLQPPCLPWRHVRPRAVVVPGAGGRGEALALPGGCRHLHHSLLFQRRLAGKGWKHLRCTCATVHTVRSVKQVPEPCCQHSPTSGSASPSCTASPRAVQAAGRHRIITMGISFAQAAGAAIAVVDAVVEASLAAAQAPGKVQRPGPPRVHQLCHACPALPRRPSRSKAAGRQWR